MGADSIKPFNTSENDGEICCIELYSPSSYFATSLYMIHAPSKLILNQSISLSIRAISESDLCPIYVGNQPCL
jgi:hypothetical protein